MKVGEGKVAKSGKTVGSPRPMHLMPLGQQFQEPSSTVLQRALAGHPKLLSGQHSQSLLMQVLPHCFMFRDAQSAPTSWRSAMGPTAAARETLARAARTRVWCSLLMVK
jgi:hypothetical protein